MFRRVALVMAGTAAEVLAGGGAQGGGPLAEAGGLFVALRPVAEVSGGRYGLGDGHSWGEQRDGEGDGREGGG
ncbi:hypothetical protein ACFQE7_13185 [Nonomuraea ferruginea]|uniref:hypothetical protein n=1 Tax=Nonomuraea ferruginea TaxID=46174 RepID=UPI003624585F